MVWQKENIVFAIEGLGEGFNEERHCLGKWEFSPI
jgi:hypothetical protein